MGVRWLENEPVVKHLIPLLPLLVKFVKAVTDKEIKICKSASYLTMEAALRNVPLLLAKLEFFANIALVLEPFLTEFQSNQPLVPLLYDRITGILRSLMSRFIKAESIKDKSGASLAKLDVKKDNVFVKDVEIGFGASRALASLSTEVKMKFRKEALEIMQSICIKIQERSPIKYPMTKYASCFNPD